jgi:hypothetical protein
MPFKSRPPRTKVLLAGLTTFIVAFAMVPALAAACPQTTKSKIFSKFGDESEYSLASGGSFESGAAGWTLNKASVTSGNESYNVAGGSHSLTIQPNGYAVTPVICVSTENPSFRLFARRTSGTWAVLNAIVRWTDASGTKHETESGAISTSNTSWALSQKLALGSMLPLWQAGSSLNVQIVFKPEASGGALAIDDVYVDPYRK